MNKRCHSPFSCGRTAVAGHVLLQLLQALLVIAVLVAAVTVTRNLMEQGHRPVQTPATARPLRVDGLTVAMTNFPVAMTGYGTAQALRKVVICAEVPGLVTNVHSDLRVGAVISAGESLFCLDDRDYRAAEAEAAAAVEQNRQTIARYREELRRNKQRLTTLERTRDLSAGELERIRNLLKDHEVGSQADVDAVEQAVNMAQGHVDEMAKLLALTPSLINEAEAVGKAAQARLDRAQRQVSRCEVKAPFDARVCAVAVEKNSYIHAGATAAVTLADDSVLEILVSLDALEAQRWLQFEEGARDGSAWFSKVEPVVCSVRWTEDPELHQWSGTLHRVERFSTETRTLMLVVRVSGEQAKQGGGFPLVEGMFCSVTVPGHILEGVCRVPRWAVTVDQTVYTAVDGHLRTRSVRVAHTDGDYALIDQGLDEGDVAIVTRLSDPLEGSPLDVSRIDAGEAKP